MNNVFTFHGCDHKCGTTMIAQSVAEAIATKEKDLKVLFIHTEKDSCDIYSPNVSESLENIKPYLIERLVDMEDLIQKSRYKDNLFIIGGIKNPGSSSSFHPDMSEYLLAGASSLFDIVICDSGSDIENGMSIGSLFAANDVYLVVSQSEYSVRKYESFSHLYQTINLPVRKVIVNKYSKNAVNNKAALCSRLEVKSDNMLLVSESYYGDKAELEGKTLYQLKDIKFKKEVDVVAKDVLKRAGYGSI